MDVHPMHPKHVPETPRYSRGRRIARIRKLATGLLFVSPWVVGFCVFLAFPVVMSVYYSLCDYAVLTPPRFIGIDNFRELAADTVFHQALLNTLAYAAMTIPLGTLVSFGLAILLNTGVRGMPIYRTIFYLPSTVPAVAVAVVWMWLLNGSYGVVNHTLAAIPAGKAAVAAGVLGAGWLGWLTSARSGRRGPLGFLLGAGLGAALLGALALARPTEAAAVAGYRPEPPAWLGDAAWVKPSFVLMSLWGSGNAMLIYLAGLQGVPGQLYESAELDGAGWWQKLRHVTLPTVSPVLLFNAIVTLIGSFKLFALPFMVAPTGSPDRSAYFVAVNLYDTAFVYLRMGYASAMAWVIFAVVFLLTLLALRLGERHVHYGGV